MRNLGIMGIQFSNIVNVDRVFTVQSIDQNALTAHATARLFDGDELIEQYELNISIANEPFLFPLVSERTDKIPVEADRHVNPDGSFCLGVYARQIILIKQGLDFNSFIGKVLLPFLANQTLINKGVRDNFILGEMPHYHEGIKSYYYDFLNTRDHNMINRFINVAMKSKIPKKKNCPCKGGNIIKQCHLNELNTLNLIGQKQLSNDIKYFS